MLTPSSFRQNRKIKKHIFEIYNPPDDLYKKAAILYHIGLAAFLTNIFISDPIPDAHADVRNRIR